MVNILSIINYRQEKKYWPKEHREVCWILILVLFLLLLLPILFQQVFAVDLGVAPQKIRDVIGVTKAYCTRVGSGPFPTELENEIGEELRKIGNEFGATTGRPRRCGWIDLVALQFACMINGVTKIVMTKADVLDAFKELQVCTGYKINGKESREIPFQLDRLKVEAVYKTFPGWNTNNQCSKIVQRIA